jgi:beta-N-acetylhexosaminidase
MAIGTELRAAGINVNYAPVADLATNPRNPSLGVRSFGADWRRAAVHVAAMVTGLESAGVAATLKHFPGKGDAGVDTHHELARVDRSLSDLHGRELRPFMAGISAGASLVMSGHFAIPSLTGSRPATLTPAIMQGLLREELGFRGVTISDAFDMEALSPGDGRLGDAVDGLNGGLDLLLLGSTSDVSAFDGVLRAADADGRLDAYATAAAIGRVRALRQRLADVEPVDLGVIGGEAHLALARSVSERALTLVRDRDGLLPVRRADGDPVLVIMPRPVDLTPADTSAAEPAGLAAAIRRHHPATEELLVGHVPTPSEIDAAVSRARTARLVVIGTISAHLHDAQAALVSAVVHAGPPTITIAMRTPWDASAYPSAGTHVCTYSLVEPSCLAVADALFGRLPFPGRLPVAEAVV